MRKFILTTIICFVAITMGYAQLMEETVLQPTHVIGRRISENGEVIKEMISDFSYQDDGKLQHYEFPEYALTGNFHYADDFLTQESVYHGGGQHPYYETTSFTYEFGRVKTVEHLVDQMESCVYWLYSYYDDGRLKQKDQKEDFDDDYHMHWLYDYENEGRTVIKSYWTSWVSQGMRLREKTTSHYNDEYVMQSSLTETYNVEGELTLTRLTSYTYTPNGMLDKEITQKLIDSEWVNAAIVSYAYDIYNRIAERIEGTWDAENDEWVETKKIAYAISEDEETCTVSFYKKAGEDWQWDVFDNQTILFGSELEAQQRMIGYMAYESFHGQGNINQIEFTLEETSRPVYLDVDENQPLSCGVYPNPGRDKLNVVAPLENAVVRIFNMQGQLVKASPFDFTSEISTEDMPSGVYVWEIWNGIRKEASGKWVKE